MISRETDDLKGNSGEDLGLLPGDGGGGRKTGGTMIFDFNKKTGEQFGIAPAELGIKDWSATGAIVSWQIAHQLNADGWFGPGSARARLLERELKLSGLHVKRPLSLPMRFFRRCDPQTPWSILVHDTVTRTSSAMERTLINRKLSTHFAIQETGHIVQYSDPGTTWALHGAAFNQESIGIDMINLLDPHELDGREEDAARRIRIVNAPWSPAEQQAISWTEAQRVALRCLVDVLCMVFEIPRHVPAAMTGFGKVEGINDRTFRGVLAHAHFSTKRWDGLQVVPLLLGAGFEPWRRPE